MDGGKCCANVTEAFQDGHKKGLEEGRKENAELKNVVKLLITTLNDTTWDEGKPGFADSKPGHRCPNCSCKDCYRISCKYNESELFKKIYKRFPELYEN